MSLEELDCLALASTELSMQAFWVNLIVNLQFTFAPFKL